MTTEILLFHMLYLLITGLHAASYAGIYFPWDDLTVAWIW